MGREAGLLTTAREQIRTRHMSYRTEKTYLHWMHRFILFHNRRHPREMGAPEVEAFLTHLAVVRKVSASTQNQALQAILFLYRRVLGIELPWLTNVTRAPRARHLPVVLTRAEVARVMAELQGNHWLIAGLLYGGGLRLSEALRLRVKDLALERGEVLVRDGKGPVTKHPTSGLWVRRWRAFLSQAGAASFRSRRNAVLQWRSACAHILRA